MNSGWAAMTLGCVGLVTLIGLAPLQHAMAQSAGAEAESQAARCEHLLRTDDLTITTATLSEARDAVPEHCYVRGTIGSRIRFHVQLPLPEHWNGRFLMWGDGGKDGNLDYANGRLAEGYAVANSNTGHDAGAQPGASFGFNDRQAEIDFGYRAVHLTTNAAKAVVEDYYGQGAEHSYFEGCSTGGRQGLMEAQRFPHDFDGIVAGAPVNHYQELNAGHTWLLQHTFRDDFAGNLAHDTDGDGLPDDLTKLDMLAEAVLERCDASDGIEDGVVGEPLACDFEPRRELRSMTCPAGEDRAGCFTPRELQTIEDFYRGPYDSQGTSVLKGRAPGAEAGWEIYIPHEGNSLYPLQLNNARDHTAFLFYDEDPGIPVPYLTDLSYEPEREGLLPEWAWWEFDIDDITAGRAATMKAITNATDPDLERFLTDNEGKLLLWHGWADAGAPPAPTLDYYEDVVATTFDGDVERTREHARLFMFPGMGHCGGGPGPNEWDPLAPLVDWVENGEAPDYVVARHETDGRVDNERRVCAHPARTVFAGTPGTQNDPESWTAENFACETRLTSAR